MEGLKKSWLIIVEVWEKGLFGIDISRIVVAVIIFFGFLLIRRLFSKIETVPTDQAEIFVPPTTIAK